MASRRGFIWAVQQIDATTPLPEAAAVFARAGVPVFPCAPGGKQPVTGQGFKNATTDLAQVQAWWHRSPAANIGMPTGAASGAVVVDVDVHGPVNGYDALNRADRAGLVSGWGLAARSASGGLHLYYPATEGVEQRSWQAGRAAIDFRGDGGYIIVPPSRRAVDGTEAFYRVERINPGRVSTVDAQALRDFLDPKPPPRPRPTGLAANPSEAAGRLAGWAARVPEGQRNSGVFWAACKMAENGVDPSVAAGTLTEATEQPDFDAREIGRIVVNAYRRVHATTPTTRTEQSTGPPAVDRCRLAASRAPTSPRGL